MIVVIIGVPTVGLENTQREIAPAPVLQTAAHRGIRAVLRDIASFDRSVRWQEGASVPAFVCGLSPRGRT